MILEAGSRGNVVLGAECRHGVGTHEDWLEANRYINMKLLKEHKRERMKEAA